jgi:hypothetical protein
MLKSASAASLDEAHGGSKLRQKPVPRFARLSGLTGAVE